MGFLVLSVLFIALSADAGVVIKQSFKLSNPGANPMTTVTTFISEHGWRYEYSGGMTIVCNPEKGIHNVTSKGGMDSMRAQMLKNMSPEQRKKIEKALAAQDAKVAEMSPEARKKYEENKKLLGDPQAMEAMMKGRNEQALTARKEALAKMSPERRAQFEKEQQEMYGKMADSTGKMRALSPEPKKLGPLTKVPGSFKVREWDAVKYQGTKGDEKWEIYVAKKPLWSLTASEKSASKTCSEKMLKNVEALGARSEAQTEWKELADQCVLKVISPHHVQEVISFEQKSLPKSLFE